MKPQALALSLLLAFGAAYAAPDTTPARGKPFTWQNATVYFLLTDRFNTPTAARTTRPSRAASWAATWPA